MVNKVGQPNRSGLEEQRAAESAQRKPSRPRAAAAEAADTTELKRKHPAPQQLLRSEAQAEAAALQIATEIRAAGEAALVHTLDPERVHTLVAEQE